MKTALTLFCLLFAVTAFAAGEYDNGYCKDPVELQKWSKMLEENPDSDVVSALHALWVGLCVQVEMHNLTTERANRIFENFRWGLIESIQKEQEQNNRKPAT